MASEMEFSQHNKVKRRSPWHGPMVLVLLFFVVILIMSLAFRVSKIEVINASEYTDEEIINASGVERGANLFFVDRFKAASMIFSDLPYGHREHHAAAPEQDRHSGGGLGARGVYGH